MVHFSSFPTAEGWLSQVVLVIKNPPTNAGDAGDVGSIPGSGRSFCRGWQPTQVFLPGESNGHRRGAGYSPGVTKSQT